MLVCCSMLKAFRNPTFYSSPVIMNIYSYFLCIGKRKASENIENQVIMYFALLE